MPACIAWWRPCDRPSPAVGPPQTLAIVQARGALRRELHACLRSGRVRRRAQHRTAQPGVLTDMVLISERPPRSTTGRCPVTGRRPHHRRPEPLRDRHPGRAPDPLRRARRPARRALGAGRPRRPRDPDPEPPHPASPDAHLGRRPRDGRTRPVHRRHRRRRVLLRAVGAGRGCPAEQDPGWGNPQPRSSRPARRPARVRLRSRHPERSRVCRRSPTDSSIGRPAPSGERRPAWPMRRGRRRSCLRSAGSS